jgi:DNA-binding transcriptional regulator YiaG
MTTAKKNGNRKTAAKTNDLGRKLMQSVEQALYAATTGDMTGITIREVEIIKPGEYGPRDVKALRKAAGVSQKVFAEMLGVSKELAAQWEYGIRQPGAMARRLFDRVKEDPVAFRTSLLRRRDVRRAS